MTTSPTPNAASGVRAANTSRVPDMSRPRLAKRARMPMARRMPRPRPIALPTEPTTKASKSTDLVTCRRDAPRARKSASSRLRCATSIEKVFTIRKEPTTREIAAKTSRKTVRNEIALSRSLAASWAALSPVTASTPFGSTLATWSRRSCCETPGLAVTHASLKASLPSRKSFWALAVSKIAAVAPLSDPPPGKSAMPTNRGWRSAFLPTLASRTFSPR